MCWMRGPFDVPPNIAICPAYIRSAPNSPAWLTLMISSIFDFVEYFDDATKLLNFFEIRNLLILLEVLKLLQTFKFLPKQATIKKIINKLSVSLTEIIRVRFNHIRAKARNIERCPGTLIYSHYPNC